MTGMHLPYEGSRTQTEGMNKFLSLCSSMQTPTPRDKSSKSTCVLLNDLLYAFHPSQDKQNDQRPLFQGLFKTVDNCSTVRNVRYGRVGFHHLYGLLLVPVSALEFPMYWVKVHMVNYDEPGHR